MAIAVTDHGTANGTTGATLALSLGVSVGAASLIVVLVAETGTISAAGNVTATAGNIYTKAASKANNNNNANGWGAIFYAWNSLALVAGNSITYTKNTSGKASVIAALSATGILSLLNPLDLIVTPTSGSSGAPS